VQHPIGSEVKSPTAKVRARVLMKVLIAFMMTSMSQAATLDGIGGVALYRNTAIAVLTMTGLLPTGLGAPARTQHERARITEAGIPDRR
jgi:hypothetical protein